ncbi:MAG TPA: hypothetical protein VFT56_01975 [Sphingomonas sp.]|nr:hypothetical protein [Sphingomonas sp.]
MRYLLIPVVIMAAASGAAHAQNRAAPAPASAPAPALAQGAPSAPLNGDTPIETIAADPAGKMVLEKDLPHLLTHPSYETFKSMSLRQLEPYSGGALTDAQIAKVETDLKAAGR